MTVTAKNTARGKARWDNVNIGYFLCLRKLKNPLFFFYERTVSRWHISCFSILWVSSPAPSPRLCIFIMIHPKSNKIVPLWLMSLLRKHCRVAALKVKSLRQQQGSPCKKGGIVKSNFYFKLKLYHREIVWLFKSQVSLPILLYSQSGDRSTIHS